MQVRVPWFLSSLLKQKPNPCKHSRQYIQCRINNWVFFLFILVLSQIHGHNLIDQTFRLTEPSIEAVRTWNSPRLWLMISTKQFTADVVKSPCRTSTQFLASLLWIPMGQQQFKGCQQEYSCSLRNSVWEDIQLHGWSN